MLLTWPFCYDILSLRHSSLGFMVKDKMHVVLRFSGGPNFPEVQSAVAFTSVAGAASLPTLVANSLQGRDARVLRVRLNARLHAAQLSLAMSKAFAKCPHEATNSIWR